MLDNLTWDYFIMLFVIILFLCIIAGDFAILFVWRGIIKSQVFKYLKTKIKPWLYSTYWNIMKYHEEKKVSNISRSLSILDNRDMYCSCLENYLCWTNDRIVELIIPTFFLAHEIKHMIAFTCILAQNNNMGDNVYIYECDNESQ